jgi:hypothetical protein
MWYQKFYTYILILGFVRRKDDQCVYSKEEGDHFIYVALYANDMPLDGNNMDVIKEMKNNLSSKFDMKDLGAVDFILGMKIKRDQAIRNIWVNQRKYSETILKRFNMQNWKPVKASIPMGEIVEQCPKTQEEIEDMAHVPYVSFVGSMICVMVCTWLDIAHALGVLRRYMPTLGKENWTTVKIVFMYLCGTKYYAIFYQGQHEVDSEVNIKIFFDVN